MKSTAPSVAAPSSSARAVLLMILIGTALRLWLAVLIGLSVDESYTVSVARQLALSYFDHPPLHLWLVGGWARLSGSEAPVLLRLPFIALFAGSTWLMYRNTALACGERAGFWAALALNLTPLFTLGIASWVLPDGPLVFFSLLAVWFLLQGGPFAPRADQQHALRGWLAAGAAAGLALLSKYLAIFPILGVGAFVLSARRRSTLATPGPWLALLLVLLLFVPVLAWNAQHGWISLAFQGGRATPSGFSLGRAALDLSGQLAYLLPWTAVALLAALVGAWRRGPESEPAWLFACLATGPIVLFALAGLWTTVLPHWPAIGWLFAFPLLGERLARLEAQHSRAPAWGAGATAAALAGLIALFLSQARGGWLDGLLPAIARNDPTLELLDWRALDPVLEQRGLLEPGTFVATVSWIDAGKVDYALAGRVPVVVLGPAAHQYAFLHDPRSFAGHNAVILANARRADWRRIVGPHFDRIEAAPDIVLRRAGAPAVILKVARGVRFVP